MWRQSKMYTLVAGLLMGGFGLPASALAQFRIDIDDGRGYRGGYGDAAELTDRLSERLRDVHVDLHRQGLIEHFQPQMNYARESIDELKRRLRRGDAPPPQIIAQFRAFDRVWHELQEHLLTSFGPHSPIGRRVAIVSDLDGRLHQMLNVAPVAAFDQGPPRGYGRGVERFDRGRYGEPFRGSRGYRGYERPYNGYRGGYNGSYDRPHNGYGQPRHRHEEPGYGGPAFGHDGPAFRHNGPAFGESDRIVSLAERAARSAGELVEVLERELGPAARSGILFDAQDFAGAVANLNRELRQTGSAQAAKDEATAVSRAWERLEPQLTSLPPGRFPRTRDVYVRFHEVLPELYRAMGREQARYH